MLLRHLGLLFVLAIAPSRDVRAQRPATAARAATSLVLVGPDGRARDVTPADLARLARRDTTVAAHHVTGRFGGVLLSDLLALVGAPAGDSLRGAALRSYVRVEGADGYVALFSLAELDAGFTDRIAILADRRDGAPLPASDGPFQLIVPGEKRPARWVRQVVRIAVVRAP